MPVNVRGPESVSEYVTMTGGRTVTAVVAEVRLLLAIAEVVGVRATMVAETVRPTEVATGEMTLAAPMVVKALPLLSEKKIVSASAQQSHDRFPSQQ